MDSMGEFSVFSFQFSVGRPDDQRTGVRCPLQFIRNSVFSAYGFTVHLGLANQSRITASAALPLGV